MDFPCESSKISFAFLLFNGVVPLRIRTGNSPLSRISEVFEFIALMKDITILVIVGI